MAKSRTKSIHLSERTHRAMVDAARDVGVDLGVYADNAVGYFAERGLNPCFDAASLATHELARASAQAAGLSLGEYQDAALRHYAANGLTPATERLGGRTGTGAVVSEVRKLGDRLFGFMQERERQLLQVLGGQERRHDERQADQEQNLWRLALETLARVQAESMMTRQLVEQHVVAPASAQPLAGINAYHEARIASAVLALQELLDAREQAALPEPTPTTYSAKAKT